MGPQQVRYFLAVVDHGSINAAANAIGVTQPTISQAVRSLERELKAQLFYRIGRGMVPTSAGRALVGPARRILRDIVTAAGCVPDAQGRLRGRVDVRAHPAVVSGMFSRVVAELHRRHPQVRVTVGALHDETQAATLLADAVCEIVVSHLPLADGSATTGDQSDDDAPSVLELGTQIYDLALPPADDSPQIGSMRWDELDDAMVVVPQGTWQAQRMFEAMSPHQRARQPAVVLENRESRLAFTLAGVGPTWVERSVRGSALDKGARIRTMQPALSAPYGLIYHDETLSPAARALVVIAAELVGVTPPPQPATVSVDRNAEAAEES